MSLRQPFERLASLEKEMLKILAPPGPMRAEMQHLMDLEDQMREARGEISRARIAKALKAKSGEAA